MIKTNFGDHPNNYAITEEEDGVKHAVSPVNQLTILPDGKSRLFQRRAIKGVGSGNTQLETCLVAELNGVRVYVKGTSIVVTTQDLKL